MAKVHIIDVTIGQNPSSFCSDFEFQITFDCTEELNEGFHVLFVLCFFYKCHDWIVLTLFIKSIFSCVNRVDLEWKLIYVGSAESDTYDQVLDSVLVGPVPIGRHTFVFQVFHDMFTILR